MRYDGPLYPAIMAFSLLLANATVAAAHCCHDERDVTILQQSQFRPGVHGLNDDGITDDSVQSDPPSTGRGLGSGGTQSLGSGGTQSLGSGGLGQMNGSGLGNYGAGSIGEPGPGGLGALKNGGLGAPAARPR